MYQNLLEHELRNGEIVNRTTEPKYRWYIVTLLLLRLISHNELSCTDYVISSPATSIGVTFLFFYSLCSRVGRKTRNASCIGIRLFLPGLSSTDARKKEKVTRKNDAARERASRIRKHVFKKSRRGEPAESDR